MSVFIQQSDTSSDPGLFEAIKLVWASYSILATTRTHRIRLGRRVLLAEEHQCSVDTDHVDGLYLLTPEQAL
jgi:hypothetical protein